MLSTVQPDLGNASGGNVLAFVYTKTACFREATEKDTFFPLSIDFQV
ncbi:hypothetical protein SAMN04487897_10949 [Paenibacillus sp. yr247]|nr:hypothetical protein SAMN04487897_10949 [Paenibacillus sp. yr247]